MPLIGRRRESSQSGSTVSQSTLRYSDPSSAHPRSIGRSRRTIAEGPSDLVRTCKIFGAECVSISKPKRVGPHLTTLQERLVGLRHPYGGHVVARQTSQIAS